ncbi:unnamed protein product [Rotaria socialis]|uniref:Uncharacterized protein n=1 Tax=Rotaria socialis TaxID=392032 RepID=A0A817V6X0_9BILA|nr:unnamed protein product [Rotaria socialis]CAF3387455.1 unnamed protein product [Rotaria socialis]CAF3420775.1 unnamed protein product [Rotaria socialis]
MPPTTLNMDITVLPPDVLSLYDESFYELVRKLAGPIEADLLELQAIRSAYSLIHTEDIFDILNNNITLASQPSAQILPTSSPLSSTTVTGTKGWYMQIFGTIIYPILVTYILKLLCF